MFWHEHVRRGIKKAAIEALDKTGILSRIRAAYMRDRAIILLYHRVCPSDVGVPDYSPNGMTVTPEEFSMQMRFVAKHYQVVSLSKIISALQTDEPLMPNMCAVTFDDGWRDIFDYAFPVLRELSLPATVFLTTGYISGSGWARDERARFLMAQVFKLRHRISSERRFGANRERLEACGFGELLRVPPQRFPQFVLKQSQRLQSEGDDVLDHASQVLEEAARAVIGNLDAPFLSWEEVREMADYGVDFGNHSSTHAVLPRLTDDEVRNEVFSATQVLKNEIGWIPGHFAYPFGKRNERVAKIVKEAGLSSGCTTHIGPVCVGDDLYALNRINISSDVSCSEALFAGRLLCW